MFLVDEFYLKQFSVNNNPKITNNTHKKQNYELFISFQNYSTLFSEKGKIFTKTLLHKLLFLLEIKKIR